MLAQSVTSNPFPGMWGCSVLLLCQSPQQMAESSLILSANTPLNVTAQGPQHCRSERIFHCFASCEQGQRHVNCDLLELKLQHLERFAGVILSWHQQLMFGQAVADRLGWNKD